MFKKLIVLGVPLVVTAGLVALPAASQADVYWKCQHGVKEHKYCEKIHKCKVPDVTGDNEREATYVLAAHDCRRGHVRHNRKHIKGIRRDTVVEQAPPADHYYRRTVHYTGSGSHRKKHVSYERRDTPLEAEGYGVNLLLNS